MKKTAPLSSRTAGSSGEDRQVDVRLIPGGVCLCAQGAVVQGGTAKDGGKEGFLEEVTSKT